MSHPLRERGNIMNPHLTEIAYAVPIRTCRSSPPPRPPGTTALFDAIGRTIAANQDAIASPAAMQMDAHSSGNVRFSVSGVSLVLALSIFVLAARRISISLPGRWNRRAHRLVCGFRSPMAHPLPYA